MGKNIITAEFKRQQRALGYSLAGLKTTWNSEASFRVELILATLLIVTAYFLDIPLLDKAALVFSVLLVLVVEVVNSAIENTVSLACKEQNPIAKAAKDQGSAAVLLGIINVIVVWTLILVSRFL